MKAVRLTLLLGGLFSAMPVIKVGPVWLADVFFVTSALILTFKDPGWITRIPRAIICATFVAILATLTASQIAFDTQDSLMFGVRLLYVWIVVSGIIAAASVSKIFSFESLAQWYAFGAALSAVAAIIQALTGLDIPGAVVQFNRMPGLTGHANAQGGVLGVALPIAIGLLLAGHKRAINLFLSLLIIIGLVLSASVSGMLAAASGILIVLVLVRRIFSGMFLLSIVCTATWMAGNLYARLIPGAKSPWERFEDTTGRGEGVSTLDQRQQTWSIAWDRIQNQPFIGYGLDPQSGATFGDILTHNLLLLCWYQGGILLLIAVLVVLGKAFFNLRARRKEHNLYVAVVALAGGSMSAVVGAMSGPQFYDRWFWLFILASAIISNRARVDARATNETSLRNGKSSNRYGNSRARANT